MPVIDTVLPTPAFASLKLASVKAVVTTSATELIGAEMHCGSRGVVEELVVGCGSGCQSELRDGGGQAGRLRERVVPAIRTRQGEAKSRDWLA